MTVQENKEDINKRGRVRTGQLTVYLYCVILFMVIPFGCWLKNPLDEAAFNMCAGIVLLDAEMSLEGLMMKKFFD